MGKQGYAGSRNRYDGLEATAIAAIRTRARQLIRKAGFSPSDLEDIEQDLVLDLLQRLPRYDSSRAQRSTFINRVVDHAVADILEFRQAGKRDGRALVPARYPWDGDEEVPPPGLEPSVAPDPHADLRIDLERALMRLPPRLQVLCHQVATTTITEIARNTGTPRSTLYDDIATIRARLTRCGLGLDPVPDVSRRGPVDRTGRPRLPRRRIAKGREEGTVE